MKILSTITGAFSELIPQTIRVLKEGGLVIFPSDTVYGLLVDATNEKAVEKLVKFKNRPPGKAISVFVADMAMLEAYTAITVPQKMILEQLLPGPFTIILPSKHLVNKLLESEKGSLGVRIPAFSLVKTLVIEFGKPITATSANLGGNSPHYSVESLLSSLSQQKKDLIDLIIDMGKLPRNKPSTVIDLTQPTVSILREGDIEFKDSKTFTTKSEEQTRKTAQFIVQSVTKTHTDKPIVFILEGDLGSGKTQFVKGAADYFEVDSIISPTFVIYYEYPLKNKQFHNLYHFDLYNIENENEFQHLGIDQVLADKNIIFIEWGEKLGKVYEEFKEKAHIVYIKINYVTENEREITVNY